MAAYQILDFFSEKTEITIVKKNKEGQLEIITKKGKEIKVEKVTDRKVGGGRGNKIRDSLSTEGWKDDLCAGIVIL